VVAQRHDLRQDGVQGASGIRLQHRSHGAAMTALILTVLIAEMICLGVAITGWAIR
jgi:hypothetical protein